MKKRFYFHGLLTLNNTPPSGGESEEQQQQQQPGFRLALQTALQQKGHVTALPSGKPPLKTTKRADI